ncbi:hypothetical protein [Methylobacterium sp. sgz302541]|uniref:hypothetical protein n=1 Tax=unclassified Methylobacterium TaxID=2615210 RepID=UPI003D3343DA
MSARFVTGAALALATAVLATAASAQSYTAPAGIPAVTAPGGLEGRAALPNLHGTESRGYLPAGAVNDGLSTGSVREPRHGAGHHNR